MEVDSFERGGGSHTSTEKIVVADVPKQASVVDGRVVVALNSEHAAYEKSGQPRSSSPVGGHLLFFIVSAKYGNTPSSEVHLCRDGAGRHAIQGEAQAEMRGQLCSFM